jgi:hypothetical protein
MTDAIYIAGPMTGFKQFNFPAFDEAAKRFRKKMKVFSPADHDRMLLGKDQDWMPSEKDATKGWKRWTIRNAPDLRTMLGDDLGWIAKHGTHMYMLKGWEKSNGARAEHALAVALGLEIIYQ